MYHPVVTFVGLLAFSLSALEGSFAATAQCSYQIVESMPEGLTFETELLFPMAKTHEVFIDLIQKAEKKIQIASFYMSLTTGSAEWDLHPSAEPGRLVLEALESAARDRKLQVDIVIGIQWTNPQEWQRYLDAGINIKILDMKKLLGDGVQHSKFMITDDKNLYIGSSNWDWRSLTQVKELGIFYEDCQPMATELAKVFETYTYFAGLESVPADIPEHLKTNINKLNPLILNMDGVPTEVYLGASPVAFNGINNGRKTDLDIILDTIAEAQRFVYISVMNYRAQEYSKFGKAWLTIENALKVANQERNVEVKLIISKMRPKFYQNQIDSWKALDTGYRGGKPEIEVKYYEVPKYDEFQAIIPHSRVKHDKYIVTDNSVFVGTSNWEPGYFNRTCGVGISIRPNQAPIGGDSILTKMKAIFNRDYYSDYSGKIRDIP